MESPWTASDFQANGSEWLAWNGQGTVNPLNTNAGLQGQGGVWQILDPFGDTAISYLKFTAVPWTPASTYPADMFESVNKKALIHPLYKIA